MKKYQMVDLANYLHDTRYRIINEHEALFDSIDELLEYAIEKEYEDDYIEDVKIYECGKDVLPECFDNIKETMLDVLEHVYLMEIKIDCEHPDYYDFDDTDNDEGFCYNYCYFGIREK